MADKKTSKEVLGLTRMSKKRIQQLCKKDKLYQTPELNDVLYLHYQGFDCIECLDDYTELKCLWLECNAISEIQGLSKQTKLKCLFLQSNLIRKIENLEYCRELDTLNLSQNHIRKIDNCGCEVLPVLNTLNLASNYLKDTESLKALMDCKTLSVLDLSNNRIDDILVVKIFSQMPELKVLVLQGNPVVSKIPQYRKTLILECKKLTYLDSRPVFLKDRACAEAWKRGGYAEERKENERWNRKERKKMRDSVNATIHLRNKHRKLEDQISRIPSSDSEDEVGDQKKNVKVQLQSEASIENIWDEVADEQDTNIYSNLEHDREDQSGEIFPTIQNTKGEESKNIMVMSMDGIEIIKQHESDLKTKMMLKEQEEHSSEVNSSEFEEVKVGEQCEERNKPKKYVNDKQLEELNRISAQNKLAIKLPESDHENHITTTKTLKQINLPLDAAESPQKLSGEECHSMEQDLQDNYELFKELDETISTLSQEPKNDKKSCKFDREKENSQPEFQTAKESLKVNNQLQTEFEELSTNISNFLNNWEIEHGERQDIEKLLFCKETAAIECSSDSTDDEGDNIAFKSTLDSSADGWHNEPKIKNTDANTHKKQEEHKMEIENGVRENVVNSRPTSNLEHVPIDIASLTRQSNDALIALEAESKVLKRLLQKLENKNEDIFKGTKLEENNGRGDESCKNVEPKLVDNEYDEILKQNIEKDASKQTSDLNCFQNKAAIEKSMKYNVEEVKQVVEGILTEIMQSLDSMPLKRNSYLYDLTENEEDLNVSENLAQSHKISKTLPEVVTSFNQLFNEIEAKQGANKKYSFEHSDKQISFSLNKLSQNPNLKQFNKDTLQTLDAQLEEIRKNQHKKVRCMVERVYAQKDRYSDTLELVDNKLMVCNQVTKELQELPQPLHSETSNSEDEYDTALSEEEVAMDENFKLFKPKPRKSCEDIIFKALNENEQIISNAESEESTDEFYSLDAQDKPDLYKIDKELFKNLNFDLSKLTEQDENRITQCAKSYEELKHYLAPNKEEISLIEPSKKLLENIVKEKSDAETMHSDKEEQLCFHENSFVKDHQQTSQLATSFEQTVTRSYLRDILKDQESGEFQHEKKSKESFLNETQLGKEEKNEVENNADIENEAAHKKLFEYKDNRGVSSTKLEHVEEKRN